jgi:hypothetical protein
VFAGGINGSALNVIDYITISSTGNSTDFGDLTSARSVRGALSNRTNERGCWCGGATVNLIDYITMSSTGNAADFGDLVYARQLAASTSNA